MSDKAQTAADLRAAGHVVQLNGFTQGQLFKPYENLPLALSPVCALGAINVVTWGDPSPGWTSEGNTPQGARRKAARVALAAFLGVDQWDVPEWNDHPGRTREEVIAAFNAAADALEAAK
jgi:hypothetical protein